MLPIHEVHIQKANISSPMGNEAFQLNVIVGVSRGAQEDSMQAPH